MIGFVQGTVLASDKREALVLTAAGVAYQVVVFQSLTHGQAVELYTSPIIKENSQELFGFSSMREKKLFELILNVKGVGPKGAFALVGALGYETVVDAIARGDKKALQRAPGIGAKAAAQILLDLEGKMSMTMATSRPNDLLGDTLLACEQLGLRPEHVATTVQRLLKENPVTKPEQLVRLVLKEMQ